MKSKAYETLGIVRPKRTLGGVIRSFFRKVIVLGILAACAWAGFQYWTRRGGGAAPTAVSEDDGNLYIREHLTVEEVAKFDVGTRQVGGRMVATCRRYWFRLSIDERWYFGKFVPQAKKRLAEIAPDAATESVALDTKDLAYANDGADRLQRQGSGTMQEGDWFKWPSAGPAARIRRLAEDAETRRNERLALLIDESKDNGACTMATLYKLNMAQMEKFENWVVREVLRDRTDLTAVMTCGGKDIAAGRWSGKSIYPIDTVSWQGRSCYALSPWLNVQRGVRCRFLGISCAMKDGIPDKVETQWTL